ncbi:MAG: protein kinase [Parachlamydiaceae bacterium]
MASIPSFGSPSGATSFSLSPQPNNLSQLSLSSLSKHVDEPPTQSIEPVVELEKSVTLKIKTLCDNLIIKIAALQEEQKAEAVQEFVKAGGLSRGIFRPGIGEEVREQLKDFFPSDVSKTEDSASQHSPLSLQEHSIFIVKKSLGKGASGLIHEITQLSLSTLTTSTWALKTPKMDEPAKTLKRHADLQMEYQTLKTITELAHQDGRESVLEGLQQASRQVTYIMSGGELGIGLMGKVYKKDLFNYLETITHQEILQGTGPLIKALAFIQEKELIHIDIKLENIFVDTNDRGEMVFCLGDFGGARWAEELKTSPPNLITHTRVYTPSGEVKLDNAKALKRISSFQLGVSLFIMLTQTFGPYATDPNSYQVPKKIIFDSESLKSRAVPQEFINFIGLLTNPNPAQRPIEEALSHAWDEFITQPKIANILHPSSTL